MLPSLAVVAAGQGGAFTRAQALAAGYTPGEVKRRLSAGRWVRLDRGCYAAADVASLPAADRHRLAARAVLLGMRADAVASHVTAAVVHGLPLIGDPPGVVHLTTPGWTRRRPGLVVHQGELDAAERTEAAGIPVTALARTVVDVARAVPFRRAVVVADAACRLGLTADELSGQLLARPAVPGIARAQRVGAFADGASESPGESLSRVAIAAHGLPAPLLQAVLVDGGEFVARADFLFADEATVGEFDGALKYTDRAILLAEKAREDRIRALGLELVRWGRDDAFRDFSPTAARLRAAFARVRHRRSA